MLQISMVSATMFRLWTVPKHPQHLRQGLNSFKVLIGPWNLEINCWTILQYFSALDLGLVSVRAKTDFRPLSVSTRALWHLFPSGAKLFDSDRRPGMAHVKD